MNVNEMINVLKHYTNLDIENYPEEKIIEIYNNLFKEN